MNRQVNGYMKVPTCVYFTNWCIYITCHISYPKQLFLLVLRDPAHSRSPKVARNNFNRTQERGK